MERQKTKMIELPDLEREILSLCVFKEKFSTICEECQGDVDPKIVADAIKNLLDLKLLRADNVDRGQFNWMYDGDQMNESSFVLTAKGMDYLPF